MLIISQIQNNIVEAASRFVDVSIKDETLNELIYYEPDVIITNKKIPKGFKKNKTKIVSYHLEQNENVDLYCCQNKIKEKIKTNIRAQLKNVMFIGDVANIHLVDNPKRENGFLCRFGVINIEGIKESNEKLLYEISKLGKTKVVGEYLSLPIYIGDIKRNQIPSFIKSCDFFLDLDGRLILDCAYYGCFCLSLVPNSLYPYLSIENIKAFNDKNKRKTVANTAKKKIIGSGFTSYHLLYLFLKKLNIENKELNEKLETICSIG